MPTSAVPAAQDALHAMIAALPHLPEVTAVIAGLAQPQHQDYQRGLQAQIAAAAALSAPPPGPTDAELLRTFMLTYMANGIASATALSKAKADVAAYRKATAAPYAVPL